MAQSWARCGELLERPPGAGALGQPDLGDHLVGCERGLEEPEEEVVGLDPAGAGGVAHRDAAPEREERGREVGGGIAVGQRPGERAAVADLGVADLGRGGREERGVGPDHGARDQRGVPDEAADDDLVAVLVDPVEAHDVVDVDEDGGGGQPQLHEREERVAAGDELGLVAVLGQGGDGRVDGVGASEGEGGRDHGATGSPDCIEAAPATTAATMLW